MPCRKGPEKRKVKSSCIFLVCMWCSVLASSLAPLILGMVAQYFVVTASERHFCSKGKKTSMNRRPRCVWLNVCQVVQSLSYSPTPVPLNQLSNQRERIWGKPPPLSVSLCPSQTHSLVFVSLFSLSPQNPVPLFRSTYPKFSIKSKWRISKWDLWYCHMLYGNSTGNAVLNSSNSNAHFAY